MPLINNDNPWDDCPSDEDNSSNYEYKYEEEEATMSIKKFKWLKVNAENIVVVALKGPVNYVEEVIAPQGFKFLTVVEELMEPDYVLPFGYPTEQFFG